MLCYYWNSLCRREYSAQPPNKLEEFVKRTRIQATNIKAEYQPIIEKIVHVADTGKAHTSRNHSPYLFAIAQIVRDVFQFSSTAEALWHVRNDTTTRVGVMALGGIVTGLIAAKRRGWYNKMSSLLIGLGGKSRSVSRSIIKLHLLLIWTCTYI